MSNNGRVIDSNSTDNTKGESMTNATDQADTSVPNSAIYAVLGLVFIIPSFAMYLVGLNNDPYFAQAGAELFTGILGLLGFIFSTIAAVNLRREGESYYHLAVCSLLVGLYAIVLIHGSIQMLVSGLDALAS